MTELIATSLTVSICQAGFLVNDLNRGAGREPFQVGMIIAEFKLYERYLLKQLF